MVYAFLASGRASSTEAKDGPHENNSSGARSAEVLGLCTSLRRHGDAEDTAQVFEAQA